MHTCAIITRAIFGKHRSSRQSPRYRLTLNVSVTLDSIMCRHPCCSFASRAMTDRRKVILAAHNARFDLTFLVSEAKKAGFGKTALQDAGIVGVLDTLSLLRHGSLWAQVSQHMTSAKHVLCTITMYSRLSSILPSLHEIRETLHMWLGPTLALGL